MLGELLAACLELTGLVQKVLALLGIVVKQGDNTAKENSPFEIDTATQEILAIVEDSTFGNQALRNTIDTNATLATAQYDDVVARIDLLQLAASPVTLPTTPPAGYGGSLDASAVWGFPIGAQGYLAGDLVGDAGALAKAIGNAGAVQTFGSRWVTVEGFLEDYDQQAPTNGPPFLNLANILLTDDRSSFLNREWSVSGGWVHDTSNDTYYYPDNPITNQILWRFTMSALEFAQIQQGVITGTGSIVVPPVWPGVGHIDTGPAIPLSDGLNFTGPLDGVLVHIIGVPPRFGSFDFGSEPSFLHLGAVAFANDAGFFEAPQNLGFRHAIYTPRSMNHAGSVVFRINAGVTGTAQQYQNT